MEIYNSTTVVHLCTWYGLYSFVSGIIYSTMDGNITNIGVNISVHNDPYIPGQTGTYQYVTGKKNIQLHPLFFCVTLLRAHPLLLIAKKKSPLGPPRYVASETMIIFRLHQHPTYAQHDRPAELVASRCARAVRLLASNQCHADTMLENITPPPQSRRNRHFLSPNFHLEKKSLKRST